MTHKITLTASAAKRIKTLAQDAQKPLMLRIMVEGGGCSGFQYKLDMVAEKDAEFEEISYDGATALVDNVSLPLMDGSIIDYVEELIGSQFKIINPNATSSCGCGISFSV